MRLSVSAAAAEAPDDPALVIDDRVLSWAALAETAAGAVAGAGPVALEMTPTVETLARLYGCLEARRPVLLLHPASPPAERARLASMLVDDPRCAVVVPTSGTTGAPRGVILSAEALVASAEASAANLGWRDGDRWFAPLPLAHVGGLMVLVRCLVARRAAILVTTGAGTTAGLEAGLARGATLVSMVPTQLHRLVEAGVRAAPGVRAVLVGGAASADVLLARATALGWPVLSTYGSSETGSQVVTWPYGLPWRAGAGVGRPLGGVELRVEDGELLVRGPMLAAGMVAGDGAVTWRERGAWHATGDLGTVDAAGFVHVHGRRDDVIITGGENVSPAAVEAVLLAVPGVRAAAVFGAPDADLGETVAAALVVGCDFDRGALDRELAARLPGFARPRAWARALTLVPPDGLKCGKMWLREQFLGQLMATPEFSPGR